MNARTKIHQLHLNEWITRFSEQKASGLTVKQWCEQKHLSVRTYNYWKHLVKEDLSRQVLPDIVPLAFPNSEHTSVPTESNTPVSYTSFKVLCTAFEGSFASFLQPSKLYTAFFFLQVSLSFAFLQ